METHKLLLIVFSAVIAGCLGGLTHLQLAVTNGLRRIMSSSVQ